MGQGLSLTSAAQSEGRGSSGCLWQPQGPSSTARKFPLNMGLGSARPQAQVANPVCPASPLRTPHLPCCRARFPSLLRPPALTAPLPPFPSPTAHPTSPALLHGGWSRGPWGSQGAWAQRRTGSSWGSFLLKADQLRSPGKTSHPPAPGDGNGLQTLTPAHEGGPLLVPSRATPLPQT